MADYDLSQESKYIMYQHMNNLNGYALSQKLPLNGYRFLKREEIKLFGVMTKGDDEAQGYIIEADLSYPDHLDDDHNDYPLAAEHVEIKPTMLSVIAKDLLNKLGKKPSTNSVKLAWVELYVRLNTKMRAKATSTFEKTYWKLCITLQSMYEKYLENLRKRIDIHLVTNKISAKRHVAQPSFHHFDIINDNLTLIMSTIAKIYFNRSLAVGFSVLDFSKLHMCKYHYNNVRTKYGQNVKLLFSDTDSLTCEIKTNDMRIYAKI